MCGNWMSPCSKNKSVGASNKYRNAYNKKH